MKYREENKQNFPLTDNRMTRFFISLKGAVEFVVQSFKIMDKGEIFVPKMPSVYIKDLIKVISPKMSIKISGIRPGEKIDEILISKDEAAQTIEVKNSYIVCPNNTFVNSSLLKKFKHKKKLVNFEYNSRNNKNFLKAKQIVNILKDY